MGNTETLADKLRKIGDATRQKTGGTELLTLDEISQRIQEISEESHEPYEGPIQFTPSFETQVLKTASKALEENIVIRPIDVIATSNPEGGKTLII